MTKLSRLLHSFLANTAKAMPAFVHGRILNFYRKERELSQRHGVLCIAQDWSSPVTVASDIDVSKLGVERDLPGIVFDLAAIQELGGSLGAYASEFPWRSSAAGCPEVPWGFMFPTMDSVILYSMIRHFKPSTFIEVGCGYSSRVSSAATHRNRSEGSSAQAKYIEPYPGERIEIDKLVGELIVERVQDLPLDLFSSLKSGDMLFIDTSHIIKCQSDVEWELLHILPSLQKGVIVHIHDVYTPFEYPLEWLNNNYAPGQYNEQYAFEALLSGGSRFKPIFPVHWMCRHHHDTLHSWMGCRADLSRSFWLIVE